MLSRQQSSQSCTLRTEAPWLQGAPGRDMYAAQDSARAGQGSRDGADQSAPISGYQVRHVSRGGARYPAQQPLPAQGHDLMQRPDWELLSPY